MISELRFLLTRFIPSYTIFLNDLFTVTRFFVDVYLQRRSCEILRVSELDTHDAQCSRY